MSTDLEAKMDYLPRIIQEFLSVDWINHLFHNFNLEHKNVPEYKFEQYLYSHSHKIGPKDIGSLSAKSLTLSLSEYFNTFSITILVENLELFEEIEKYCANTEFSQEDSFWIIGSREKSYAYLHNDFITTVRIAKMTEEIVRVSVAHTIIGNTYRKNIERRMILIGKLNFSNKKITPKIKDTEIRTQKEIDSINKWKNIRVVHLLQSIENEKNRSIMDRFEISIDVDDKSIRSIYVTEDQLKEIRRIYKDENALIRVEGEFEMFDDYQVVLKSIDSLKVL